MTKTEVICLITVKNKMIDRVDEYVYMGQTIKSDKENQTGEIKRRVQLGWMALNKLSYVLKTKSIDLI